MTTEAEFNDIVLYAANKLLDIWKEGEGLTGEDVIKLLETTHYADWKATKKVKSKKVEISKEVEEAFEIFWQAFPSKSAFEYKGKKFAGERVLKANKQVCLKLYNDCVQELGKGWSDSVKTAASMIYVAMQVQVANMKIESYKNSQNRMQYMSSIEVYLRQKKYEAYLGETMPEEMQEKKVYSNSTDQ